MADTVRTYDPSEVSVSVGLTPVTGFADGTFVVCEKDADSFSKVVGIDGIVSRVKTRNRAGSVKITLTQTSPSNDQFSLIATLDELSNTGIVPISVKDNNGTSLCTVAWAWVKKIPSLDNGKDLSNREWIFDTADMDLWIGASNGI